VCDMFFRRSGAWGILPESVTHSSRYGLRSFARYAGYDAERVTQRRAGETAGRLAVAELQQSCSGQGNGSGVPRTVRCVACIIPIDDVRLPLGYLA
jgi:hypothetical protein